MCPLEPGKREKGGTVPQVLQSLASLHQIVTYSPFRGFEGWEDRLRFLVLYAKGYGTEKTTKSEATKGSLKITCCSALEFFAPRNCG